MGDTVAVMDKGRIVGEGSPRELIEHHTAGEVLEVRLEAGTDPGVLAGVGTHHEVLADRVLVSSPDAEQALGEIHARGITPAMSLVRRSTLEDVFLTLTGRTLVD